MHAALPRRGVLGSLAPCPVAVAWTPVACIQRAATASDVAAPGLASAALNEYEGGAVVSRDGLVRACLALRRSRTRFTMSDSIMIACLKHALDEPGTRIEERSTCLVLAHLNFSIVGPQGLKAPQGS